MYETQAHLEVCEGYEDLRNGKDLDCLDDKVKYFQEVIKKREEMLKRIRKAKKKTKDM